MRNLELAWILTEIADLMELKGENPFKIRAYRRGSQAVQLLAEDIADVSRDGRLHEISGIGKALAEKIGEWLATGRMPLHDALRAEVPPGLLDMLAVPGVGPKLVQMLHRELQITSLGELAAACQAGKLRDMKGLGAKTEANILRGIQRLQERSGRTPLGVALPVAEEVVALIANLPQVQQAGLAGSIRRREETVGDIDVLAASDDPEPVMAAFTNMPAVAEILAHGSTKSSVLLRFGMQVDLRVVEPAAFAPALHHFTGSKEHNIRLRELAQGRGLKISEYGVARVETGEQLPIRTEAELFQLLDLPEIPPELREDAGEIEAARTGNLPELIQLADIRGDLHCHSTWSDGSASILEMATQARERGYEYLAITDHSRSLTVARGLTAARLREQREEIAEVNGQLENFRVLAGIEVDILPDGQLDLEDEVLAELDIVIASVHSGFQQDADQMTARIKQAMRNPYVDIIGHPTGRLLGRRDPYAVNMEALLDEAAATGVIMEINASPSRLDLRDVHARWARDQDILLAVCTDAHSPREFAQMPFGIAVARRAWLQANHVLNTLPLDDLLEALSRRGR